MKQVPNFPMEFSNGIKFQELVNILFGTSINLKLDNTSVWDDKLSNWTKINTKICQGVL